MNIVRAVSRMHVSPFLMLVENSLWPADDPLVVEHPEWFTDDLEPILNRTAASTPRKSRTTATQPMVEAR